MTVDHSPDDTVPEEVKIALSCYKTFILLKRKAQAILAVHRIVVVLKFHGGVENKFLNTLFVEGRGRGQQKVGRTAPDSEPPGLTRVQPPPLAASVTLGPVPFPLCTSLSSSVKRE